ncbi:hypothetical protein [Methylobacterium sp. J-067]|uniref:hypothetical protein n=1 Tax=Methylobacterium sp. J-067 TaxID=2836648 RepID=UPI001FB8A6F9|nr:hypothetical protein [Methylobacterium sp. J-067]MCJ2024689.1 hypothetical protein [Methylobacterium sp. J-067]
MRTFSTLAYGFAAALALMVAAAHVIGPPNADDGRRGGLTAATVLGSDGSQADVVRGPVRKAADATPSS